MTIAIRPPNENNKYIECIIVVQCPISRYHSGRATIHHSYPHHNALSVLC